MNQRRVDRPVRRIYVLSTEAALLVNTLSSRLSDQEHRPVSKSEVAERAVRALAKKLGVRV